MCAKLSYTTPPRHNAGITATVIIHVLLAIFLLFGVTFPGQKEPPVGELLIEFASPAEETLRPTAQPTATPSVPTNSQNTGVQNTAAATAPKPANKPTDPVDASPAPTGDVNQSDTTTDSDINPRALFRPSTHTPSTNTSSGSGATSADSNAGGVQGSGDSGISFDLGGRKIRGTLTKPTYDRNLQGKVVVNITVDKDGNVINARATNKGSTTINATLWKAAEEAAQTTKFDPSPNTPVQYGYITYIFQLE